MYKQLEGLDYYAYSAGHIPKDDRETIVFVHGTAMDHTVWALQSRYFAYHGYNILALDLPGHGLSEGESMNRIEAYAAWVVSILEFCKGRCFHLVGHSMGALICLEAAAQYEKTSPPLQSLTLIGFSYPMSVSPKLLDAAKSAPSEAFSMMTQWSHTSPVGGEPNPGFWSAGSQMSMMENSLPGTVYTDLSACNHYRDGDTAFAHTSCPILFISGVLDKMAPCKIARAEADKNSAAEIIQLPHCGHSIMSENPDGVRDHLKQFIASQRCLD